MKKILLIAFHFPPLKGSSGVHRTISMARYLPGHGWAPAVLTASPRAYEYTNPELLSEVPEEVTISRAFALDATRHLSFRGRYLQWTALPDRWISWWFGGIYTGIKKIKTYEPDLIWSTFPIATAHLIGLTLHKLTNVPWVADFRDSMTEDNYPKNPQVRALCRWIEKKTVKNASMIIFTTSGALEMYANRYPEISHDKWAVIENAVDEEFFCKVEQLTETEKTENRQKLKFLHSGILYLNERNPTFFFNAVKNLKKVGKISSDNVEFIFRASMYEEYYCKMVKNLEIDDLIFFEPSISYADAIREMLLADGLLIFQSRECNHQIPAKIYEYFRSGRPVLGLTDPQGNTAELLRQEKGTLVSILDDQNNIETKLMEFINYCREHRTVPVREKNKRYSRCTRVAQYVKLLNTISQMNE